MPGYKEPSVEPRPADSCPTEICCPPEPHPISADLPVIAEGPGAPGPSAITGRSAEMGCGSGGQQISVGQESAGRGSTDGSLYPGMGQLEEGKSGRCTAGMGANSN